MYKENAELRTLLAKELFKEERAIKRLDGWFYIKEYRKDGDKEFASLPRIEKFANELIRIVEKLPISISENAIFAGTQRDAFARSYALINPTFKVEGFSGYCDPTAVYNDIEPNEFISKERIEAMREYDKQSEFVKALAEVYDKHAIDTEEVTYFMEQVSGHVIADFRSALKNGVNYLISCIDEKIKTANSIQKSNYSAMKTSLKAALILASRYSKLAEEKANKTSDEAIKERMLNISKTLKKVPANGATSLQEAIQSFMILWETMCLEQAPNPYAFSVGNADRIFEPYRAMDNLSREDTASYLKHLLVFFNVADRSWAISQNLIVGGRDENGNDLTNETSYALFDAYLDMNLPQPILSVRLHKNTPEKLYQEMGRFFFTPGMLTPSFFNDDTLIPLIIKTGVSPTDATNYAVAGCQEPLIMGKDNANTTNTWLNLGKILELTLNGGISTISGKKLLDTPKIESIEDLASLRERFYKNLDAVITRMEDAGNGASRALSLLPVPFLSTLMGGIETGYDMRDMVHQGTIYSGSGCLIHGLTVVADSFIAVDYLLKERKDEAMNLIPALANNFEGYEDLQAFLRNAPKFGNNIAEVDNEASIVCYEVAKRVSQMRNALGKPFRPDFSTPSTHLLYGYWVGALPNGRKAREQLNYGIDPLYGDANRGLGFRTLSMQKLPYSCMVGGCASHFGIDPKYFRSESLADKGVEFHNKVIKPLFFNEKNKEVAPFYLYLNITTPEMLRAVLKNPSKYAPSGVYIMRIHGTFVNFLDLSPAIQEDIIRRLDPSSTTITC